MHKVSKKDLNSAELETMRVSKNPTTVMTANGEVQTREEATVFVKQLNLFVKVMLLEETPAVLLSREALRGSWVYPPLDQRSKTTCHPKLQENQLQYSELRTILCPWPGDEFLYFIFTCFFNIFIAGNRTHKLRSEPLQDVPEWIQDFKEDLVDKDVQPHQYSPSSSHGLPMEPRAKVVPGSGKHSICTHFPKDGDCDICLRTKITRASCRQPCPERKILVIKLPRITKFLVKDVNHE